MQTDVELTGLPPERAARHRLRLVIVLATAAGMVLAQGMPRWMVAVPLGLAGVAALVAAGLTVVRRSAGRYLGNVLGLTMAGGALLVVAVDPWPGLAWRALLALAAAAVVTAFSLRLSGEALARPVDAELLEHELRTPLAVVVGNLEIVLDDGVGDLNPGQRRLLEAADRSALRLRSRVADLVGSTAAERQRLAQQMTPHDN